MIPFPKTKHYASPDLFLFFFCCFRLCSFFFRPERTSTASKAEDDGINTCYTSTSFSCNSFLCGTWSSKEICIHKVVSEVFCAGDEIISTDSDRMFRLGSGNFLVYYTILFYFLYFFFIESQNCSCSRIPFLKFFLYFNFSSYSIFHFISCPSSPSQDTNFLSWLSHAVRCFSTSVLKLTVSHLQSASELGFRDNFVLNPTKRRHGTIDFVCTVMDMASLRRDWCEQNSAALAWSNTCLLYFPGTKRECGGWRERRRGAERRKTCHLSYYGHNSRLSTLRDSRLHHIVYTYTIFRLCERSTWTT